MSTNNNDNSQKYSDIGNQIRDSVMEAVASGDFSGLSSTITQSVNTVLGDVGDQINRAATQVMNGGNLTNGQVNYKVNLAKAQAEARARAQETARRYHEEQEARIQRDKAARAAYVRRPNQAGGTATPVRNKIKFKEVGKVSAILNIIIGGWFSFVFAMATLGASLSISEEGPVGFIIVAIITLAFVSMIVNGIKKLKTIDIAKRYNSLAGSKQYIEISELAHATGSSVSSVIKNIKKLLKKGFFPEGFLDEEETTFILSRDVYDQYKETKANFAKKQQEELDANGVDESAKVRLSPDQQAELNLMIRDGENAIRKLRELNNDIPGEAITNKLNTTESILNDIFERVRNHPEQMKNCHKLMNYHLPTMLKLVEAYAEYDKISVPSDDILKSKDEIEKTIDIINKAFTELLNRLFQDSVWDINSDVQVLKTMLNQEGLTNELNVAKEG